MTPRHDDGPTPIRAPQLARWIVETFAPATQQEFLLGDLEEQHERMAAAHGPHRAAWWYWRQALSCIAVRLSPLRLTN